MAVFTKLQTHEINKILGNYNLGQLKKFLSNVCSNFVYVLYIFGNHEFYHYPKYVKKELDELKKGGFSLSDKIDNLYILDTNSIIINEIINLINFIYFQK